MDELRVTLLSSEDSSSMPPPPSNPPPLVPSRSARVRDFLIRGKRESMGDLPAWMFPDDGETRELRVPSDELRVLRGLRDAPKHLLSEWPSTAICGNDILASVLYSSGIVAVKAGKLMPLTQLLVSVVLYFFRYIYEEAVTAIPLNGGSYNVLLNTTSKRTAAVAATLGIISYLATGVVSGTSAMQYLNTQAEMPIVGGTVALLFAFAVLSIIGIAESSTVALVIFIVHVATLTLLSGCSAVYAVQHPDVFLNNMKTGFPSVNVAGDVIQGNVLTAIFFGYSSAMLGITGFETSAQFVEEQQRGVFRKTLRNMWISATFYNFLLSCLSLAVLPLEGPGGIYLNRDIVLARMGRESAGKWLERWVSMDAFIVLAGGVLTSYVGITGLVRRLAFDRVLPNFLTITNSWRGTNHYIILLFFALQSSLVIILNADASVLAGVFTFAFLGVMSLFAFGCMLLKLKRQEIPRDVHAPWWSCIFGLIMVLLGLLGNLLGDPTIFTYFALYFIVFASIMFLMLERVFILRIILYTMQRLCPSRNRGAKKRHHTGAVGGRTIASVLQNIHLPSIVFFIKTPDLSVLNKAILYVRQNEQTHNLRVVHVYEELLFPNEPLTDEEQRLRSQQELVLKDLHDMISVFDLMYPKLKIDFISVGVPDGTFDPAVVEWLSHQLGVPPNMMFIRQPGNAHIHQVSTLGGATVSSGSIGIMETAKSTIAAIRPRSLFASAAPVAITVAVLALHHGARILMRIDTYCALAIALLVQMIANLNALYTTFHRAFNPMQAATTAKDNKIVINLLSEKLVRMWSSLFFVLILVLVGIAQVTGRRKRPHVAAANAALAVAMFMYCRWTKPVPMVGVQELVFGLAFGPIAMASTSLLLVGKIPVGVALYSIAIMCFAIAFQIIQSTADAPFARRLGVQASSLAVSLGFDRAFQAFVLFITATYCILAMSVLVQGHLPNIVLLFTMGSVREMSDAFREEKLRDLPDHLARLGAQLSAGLLVSIHISSFII